MIFLYLIFLSLPTTLNFYTDPIVYRYRSTYENVYYIEFNCQIPYQELSYEEVNKKITAKAIITFKLINLARNDSLVDTLYRQFILPSFSEAAREEISFIVQFGMYVPEGNFDYEIEIESGNNIGKIKKGIEINPRNYKISDLLLASDINSDTIGSELNKGNLRVVPHPSRIYSDRYRNIFVYYEIYDLTPDSSKLNITYEINNKDNRTVRRVNQNVEKRFKSQGINLGMPILGMPPGEYKFKVVVLDSSTNQIVTKEIPFQTTKKTMQEISYEGLPYYEEIEYFVTPEQYRYFQALSKEGKTLYLKKFWNTCNYNEIEERFEYANAHYGQGDRKGAKTERGRIYIKYGAPDEVEKTTIETEESRPYESWEYYNGLSFIFVDIRGTNEYTLVWTNARGEKSQPTLYKYLPKLKQEMIKQEH